MSKVVVDIETIGIDFESLDEKSKEYLLKYAKDEEEQNKIKESLALSPLTGEIVAIGMFNPVTEKGITYYQGKEKDGDFLEEGVIFKIKSEREMLKSFWEDIGKYKQIITFNGRVFDAPFLHLRSAILKVKPSRNLVPYRYDYKLHCDLLDQFTYYGASRRFSLDFYTKQFGIRSPKEEGIDGAMIGEMFQSGRQKEIAQYCARDIKATAKLYDYWENYLKF
ncbi:MAG: ribonuclease H-like domain-containing protein [Parcubacteria group bacterium]|jgi:hypothetical protein